MTDWTESEERKAVVADLLEHGFLSYAPTSTVEEIAERHDAATIVVLQVIKTERARVAPKRPMGVVQNKVLEIVEDWHRMGGQGQAIDGMHTLCREMRWNDLLHQLQVVAQEAYKAQAVEAG
jgi:hypothetical protein